MKKGEKMALKVQSGGSFVKRNAALKVQSGKTKAVNNGSAAGYLGARLVYGLAGIFEGFGDFVAGSIYQMSGDKDYAKYLYENDVVGGWERALDRSYNPGKGMQVAGDIASGVGQALPSVAIGIATGGSSAAVQLAGGAAMGMAYAGQGTARAVQKTGELGLKENAYGVLSGAAEGATDMLLGGTVKAGKNLWTVAKGGTKSAAGKIARNGLLKNMWSSASSEFAEEFLQEYIDTGLLRLTGVDKNATTSLGNALYSGAIGFATGTLLGGATGSINTVNNIRRGESIRQRGLGSNLLATANYIRSNYLGKQANFDNIDSPALRTLSAAVDAYNKLDANEKAGGTKGAMLLGEIQAGTFAFEVETGIRTIQNTIMSAPTEAHAAYASEIMGHEVTVEDLRQNKDGAAEQLAVTSFATGILTKSNADRTADAVYDAVEKGRFANVSEGARFDGTLSENGERVYRMDDGRFAIVTSDMSEGGEGKFRIGFTPNSEYDADHINYLERGFTTAEISQLMQGISNGAIVVGENRLEYAQRRENAPVSNESAMGGQVMAEDANEAQRAGNGGVDAIITRNALSKTAERHKNPETGKYLKHAPENAMTRTEKKSVKKMYERMMDSIPAEVQAASTSVVNAVSEAETNEVVKTTSAEREVKPASKKKQKAKAYKKHQKEKNEARKQKYEEKKATRLAAERIVEQTRGETVQTGERSDERAVPNRGYTDAEANEARALVKDFDLLPHSSRRAIVELIRSGKKSGASKNFLKHSANLIAYWRRGLWVIADDKTRDDGFYTSFRDGSRLIVVKPNREAKAVSDTLMHELAHDVWARADESTRKVLYELATKEVKQGEIDAIREKYREELTNRGEFEGVSKEEIEALLDEEVATNLIGEIIGKEEFLKRFDGTETSTLKRILRTLSNMKKRFTGKDKYLYRKADDLFKAFTKVMALDEVGSFGKAMDDVIRTGAKPIPEDGILTNQAVVIDGKGTRHSLKSMKHDIADGEMFRDLMEHCGFTKEKVGELKDQLRDLVEYMTPYRDIVDINEPYGKEGRRYSPYKPNSDPLYAISLDYSTLCSKRLLTQYVIEQLQLRENRPMSAEEQLAIRDMLIEYRAVEKGLEVACAMCYVEAARLKSPKQIQKWLDDPATEMRNYFANKNAEFEAYVTEEQNRFKELRGYNRNTPKKDMKAKDRTELNKIRPRLRSEYKPSADERAIMEIASSLPKSTYLTSGNLAVLSENHPEIYKAYTSFIRNATRSKALETDEPYYYGDSKRDNGNGVIVTDSFIKNVNRENGMRASSWSDWRIQHLLDWITAVIDLSTRGAAMHAYTKYSDEVRVLGKTGIMFNLSGVAGTQNGLNEDGSLNFSNTEGINIEDAQDLRNEFPETAGIQCIGVSMEHVLELLRSDMIDYVIPYHTSGLNATLRRMAQIYGWKDFTKAQHAVEDKSISKEAAGDQDNWHVEPVFSEFFVGYGTELSGIEAMRKSAENYKEMCKARGLIPKFSEFANEPNYWKLLIDRKMINQKTGNLIKQRAVTPDFEFDTIKRIIDKYVSNYDGGLEKRALNHIVENWDSIPERIRTLKKNGAVPKVMKALSHATIAAQPKTGGHEKVTENYGARRNALPKRVQQLSGDEMIEGAVVRGYGDKLGVNSQASEKTEGKKPVTKRKKTAAQIARENAERRAAAEMAQVEEQAARRVRNAERSAANAIKNAEKKAASDKERLEREQSETIKRNSREIARIDKNLDYLKNAVLHRRDTDGGIASSIIFEDPALRAVVKRLASRGTAYGLIHKSTREGMQDLLTWYKPENEILNGNAIEELLPGGGKDVGSVFGAYNADIRGKIERIANGEGDITAAELADLDIIINAIARLYLNYGKVRWQGKKISVEELAFSGYQEQLATRRALISGKEADGKPTVVLKKIWNVVREGYLYSVVTPEVVLRDLENNVKDGVLSTLYREVRLGEAEAGRVRAEILTPVANYFSEHKKYRRTLATDHRIEFRGYNITAAQAVGIWETSKREQAQQRMFDEEKGGIRFSVYDETEGRTVTRHVKVTQTDLDNLYNQFTEEDRGYIKALEESFKAASKYKIETDGEVWGYTNAIKGHYYPITTDENYFAKDITDVRDSMREVQVVDNKSFNKNTVQGAQAPLFIEDSLRVLERHAKGIGDYSGLYIPLQTFGLVYGAKFDPTGIDRAGTPEENAKVRILASSVVQKTSLRGYYNETLWHKDGATGGNLDKYLSKLFSDIQGIGERDMMDKLIAKIQSGYITATFGLNAKIILTQLASYGAAYKNLDADVLVQALTRENGREAWREQGELMDKYSKITLARSFEGTGAAEGLVDQIGELGRLATKGIDVTDRGVIVKLFIACQLQAEKNGSGAVGSEENLKEAGKMLDELLLDTQTTSLKADASALMRSKNMVAKMVTMFRTESMKSFSNLYTSISSYVNHKRFADSGLEGYSEMLDEDKKKIAKMSTAFLLSATWVAAMSVLFSRIRKAAKGEEEEEKMLVQGMKEIGGNVIELFPVVSEIASYMMDGYELESIPVSVINQGLSTLKNTKVLFDTEASDAERTKYLREVINTVGSFAGLPTRNAGRIALAATTIVSKRRAYEVNDAVKTNPTYQSDLDRALASGNDRLAETVLSAWFDRKKGGSPQEKVSNEILRLYSITDGEGKSLLALPKNVPSSLDRKQSAAFSAEYAKADDQIAALISSKAYGVLDDAAKAKAVKAAYDMAWSLAAESLCLEDVGSAITMAKAEVDPSIMAAVAGFAKAYSGSDRKAQVIAFLKSIGLSKKEYNKYLEALGYKTE